MKCLKKVIVACLGLMLLIVAVSMTAKAEGTVKASGACGENLTWKLTTDGVLTISGEGDMKNYEYDYEWGEPTCPWYSSLKAIPNTKIVFEEGVTSIGEYAFYQCSTVKEIVLSDSVTSIGARAFNLCTNLQKVVLGTGMEKVWNVAFSGCKITEVYAPSIEEWCEIEFNDFAANPLIGSDIYDVSAALYCNGVKIVNLKIPETVTKISKCSFAGYTQLETVEFHDEIIEIGDEAFRNSGLKNLSIPESITTIGRAAFSYCENLTEVNLPQNLSVISPAMFSNCTSLVTLELPESIKTLKVNAFTSCTALATLELPKELESIEESVFYNCTALKAIVIPESITGIQASTFRECNNLESVEIPDNVKEIGDFAFYNCSKLKNITIPEGVKVLPWNSLSGCAALTEINLPDSLVEIGDSALSGCGGISNIVIPDSVIKIGNYSFFNCSNLINITFSSTLDELGTDVFSNCNKIENVYWKGTTDEWIDLDFVSKTSNPMWSGANLYANDTLVTDVNVPNSVTCIKPYIMYGCESLEKIDFPQTLTDIGESAFFECLGLSEITIPETVETIGNYAFANCKGLTEIYFAGDVPEIGDYSFSSVTATCYYPADNTKYTSEIKNSGFGGTLTWTYEGEDELVLKFQCGDNITAVLKEGLLTLTGTGAMYDYTTDGTNYAPWYEYRNTVTEVQIGDGVTSIGDAAFYSCTVLKNVAMPDTITSIGDYAFDSCAMTSIELSKGLEEIGEYAFQNTKLQSIVIPESVTTIGQSVFYGNSKLMSAVLPDSLTQIPNMMFYACFSLQDVDLPEKFTSIGDYAFASCYGLKSMVLPEGLVSIGKGAFSSVGSSTGAAGAYPCGNFTSVTLPSTLESIGSNVFWYCQSLQSIVIPDKVKSIGSNTFGNCTGIKEVTISANIEMINADVFLNCNSLKKVTFRWNMPTINLNAFSRKVTATCYYPSNNTDWDVSIFSGHNGTLTWVGQEMEEPSEGTGGGSGEGSGEEEGEDSGESGGNSGAGSGDSEGGDSGNEGGNTGDGGSGDSGESGGNEGGGTGGDGSGTTGGEGEGSGTGTGGSGEYKFEITSQPVDYTGAINDDVAFTVTAVGDELTYEWFYSTDGGETFVKTWSTGYNTNTLAPILRRHRDGQKFYCVVTDKYGNKLESDVVTMAVETSDVTITTQPVSVDKGCQGTLYHFTVEAEGTNLEYRWYYSTDNGETWQESWIDGFNTNELNIRMNPNRSGWLFRCAVTSGLKNTVTSDEVLFQLQEASVELTGNPENVIAAVGETATFTIEATGNDLTYRWYVSTDKSEWSQTWLDGYDTATLSFPSTATRAGKYYKCVVMDGSGTVATSKAASLTLELPEIISHPETHTLNVGDTATFKVEATGTGLRYLWYVSTDGGESWSQTWLEGYNTDTLNFYVTATRAGKLYKCVVTDMSGNSVESNPVMLNLK